MECPFICITSVQLVDGVRSNPPGTLNSLFITVGYAPASAHFLSARGWGAWPRPFTSMHSHRLLTVGACRGSISGAARARG